MTQGIDKSLEYFEEIFQLIYGRVHNNIPDPDSLKLVLLRGVREELMETLNLLANGHMYQGAEGRVEHLFFINQKRKQTPKNFHEGMNHPYPFNTNYNAHFEPWCPPNTSPWFIPTPWPYYP